MKLDTFTVSAGIPSSWSLQTTENNLQYSFQLTSQISLRICWIANIYGIGNRNINCVIWTVIIHSNKIKRSFKHHRLFISEFWQSFSHKSAHDEWIITVYQWIHIPEKIGPDLKSLRYSKFISIEIIEFFILINYGFMQVCLQLDNNNKKSWTPIWSSTVAIYIYTLTFQERNQGLCKQPQH